MWQCGGGGGEGRRLNEGGREGGREGCMHLIYTLDSKLAQYFDAVLSCDSFCFIYGDHACISSILQSVSLLQILTKC